MSKKKKMSKTGVKYTDILKKLKESGITDITYEQVRNCQTGRSVDADKKVLIKKAAAILKNKKRENVRNRLEKIY